MFWTIVGAILFIEFGIPLILALLAWLFTDYRWLWALGIIVLLCIFAS